MFKCPFCNKIFTEKGNLKVHIRVHTNDRPYHCPFKDICKQSFKTKSQLSDHILKHTRVKNYCCPECKSSFLYLSNGNAASLANIYESSLIGSPISL